MPTPPIATTLCRIENEMKNLFNIFKNKKSNQVQEERTKPPFIDRMKHLEKYFKTHIEDNILFESEYLAMCEINKYALKDKITKGDLIKIIEIFNSTNKKPHYNGSGWFDLRLHLHGLIKKNGFEYQTNKSNDIILI